MSLFPTGYSFVRYTVSFALLSGGDSNRTQGFVPRNFCIQGLGCKGQRDHRTITHDLGRLLNRHLFPVFIGNWGVNLNGYQYIAVAIAV